MKKILMVVLVALIALALIAPIGCAAKSSGAASNPWTITVTDKSGKSQDFTEKDAAKLTVVDVSATLKKKDGTEVAQSWKGVTLSDVLKACNVTEFSKIKVTAVDGYEQEFEPAAVNDNTTILGFVLDGKAITADDGLLQLVVPTMSGKSWVKNVKSITAQ